MIRTLQPGQRCEVWIASVTGERELVFTTGDVLLEAPNWTLDGAALILNGAGKLWRFDVEGRTISQVPLTGIPDLNNDHVLAPDGTGIYLSANDGHIYRAELKGGPATRITAEDGTFHFLHGVSPDGQELAYVGHRGRRFHAARQAHDHPGRRWRHRPVNVGWSLRRTRILARTANGSTSTPKPSPANPATPNLPGSAPRRRRPRASAEERNCRLVPASLPRRALGQLHPFPQRHGGPPRGPAGRRRACLNQRLDQPLHAWPLFGGQGTLNVNSWSPDSTRFAYIAYPVG